MASDRKLYYKIGEVCRMLDIQPHVLRYWEAEFPPLHPPKNTAGQRVYREKDIRTIRVIRRLLYDEGFTIAGAKKKIGEAGVLDEAGALPAEAVSAGPEAAPLVPAAAPAQPEPTSAAVVFQRDKCRRLAQEVLDIIASWDLDDR